MYERLVFEINAKSIYKYLKGEFSLKFPLGNFSPNLVPVSRFSENEKERNQKDKNMISAWQYISQLIQGARFPPRLGSKFEKDTRKHVCF